jgi:hypothetical protein
MAMTNFIPTIWDETIHREKVAKDVFAENCNRKYEGTLAEKGDSVKILGVKAPTIKTLGKNVRNDGIDDAEDIVEDSVTMHINQIAYYNYKVSDFDKRESVDGVMEAVRKSTAEQLSNTTDKYIANLAKGELAYGADKTAVQVTKSNVLELIDAGIQHLYENNVSDSTEITLTVSPRFYFILKRAYAELDTNNHELMKNGKVGMYGKVVVKMSNNVAKSDNGNDDFIMLRTNEAIAYVESDVHSESYRTENGFSDGVKGYILYDAQIVRPDELYVLRVKYTA